MTLTEKVMNLFTSNKTQVVNTETSMNMMHFHDFYFLMAMDAAVKMEIANNDELQFVKKVEKFMDDLDRTIESLSVNMALRVFMYLYAACLGEARHAKDTVARERFLKTKGKMSRDDWFRNVVNFPPNAHNLGALLTIYSQDWRAGYGGNAWGNIAQALTEYQTTPAAAWLDHVVDLEHNNGTAFSKPDGMYTIMFDVSYPGRFSNFLDYKFTHDMLKTAPDFISRLSISPRIQALLTRYSAIFNKPEVTWVKADLDNLSSYVVEWGEESLTVEVKWCDWATVGANNKPDIKSLLNTAGMYDFYPAYYTKEQFLDKIEEVKKRAMKGVHPKFATKRFEQEIMQEVDNFVSRNIGKCKLPKPNKTYTLMPCTVHYIDNKTVIRFALPYQYGYGTPTDKGFEIVTNIGNDATGTGYVTKSYGDLILWVDQWRFYFNSAVLEAILE